MNIKYLLIIGLILVALVSNAQKNRYIKTNTYEGVVFSKYFYPGVEWAKQPFIPTNKEIAKMEKIITDSIAGIFANFVKNSFYKGNCDFTNDLQHYKRQYFGYKKKGEKVISVYFFRKVEKDWKEVMYPLETGACDQFRIEYSVKSGKLYDFYTDFSNE